MPRWIIALGAVALLTATAPQASGWRHHGHHGFRGHHHGHYGHYRNHHRHHGYGRVAAGFFLGGIVGHALHHHREVERTVLVSQPRGPIASLPEPIGEPVPAQRHDIYYRRDPNGACWLVETQQDGSQIITPEAAETCG